MSGGRRCANTSYHLTTSIVGAMKMAERTVSERFNDFHLAVAVYSDRTRWILSKLDISQEGVDLLTHLAEDLEELVLAADCRPDRNE